MNDLNQEIGENKFQRLFRIADNIRNERIGKKELMKAYQELDEISPDRLTLEILYQTAEEFGIEQKYIDEAIKIEERDMQNRFTKSTVGKLKRGTVGFFGSKATLGSDKLARKLFQSGIAPSLEDGMELTKRLDGKTISLSSIGSEFVNYLSFRRMSDGNYRVESYHVYDYKGMTSCTGIGGGEIHISS